MDARNSTHAKDPAAGRTPWLLSSLWSEIDTADPRLRAGILLMTNHLLDLAARTWHPALLDHPKQADPRSRSIAIEALVESVDVLEQALKWTREDEASRRQILATDLAITTLMASSSDAFMQCAVMCWKSVWITRDALPDALAAIRDWEVDTGVPGLPRQADGDYPSDAQALELGHRYPAFLRSAKRN